jgi:hypothetical protein
MKNLFYLTINLTLGVGFPTIVARRRTGTPSFTCVFGKGTTTFGGCICCISSFVGTGAFTSNGPAGCPAGPAGVEAAGRMVTLADVSSAPTGLVARAVYVP